LFVFFFRSSHLLASCFPRNKLTDRPSFLPVPIIQSKPTAITSPRVPQTPYLQCSTIFNF
jgi:hypothetical protein